MPPSHFPVVAPGLPSGSKRRGSPARQSGGRNSRGGEESSSSMLMTAAWFNHLLLLLHDSRLPPLLWATTINPLINRSDRPHRVQQVFCGGFIDTDFLWKRQDSEDAWRCLRAVHPSDAPLSSSICAEDGLIAGSTCSPSTCTVVGHDNSPSHRLVRKAEQCPTSLLPEPCQRRLPSKARRHGSGKRPAPAQTESKSSFRPQRCLNKLNCCGLRQNQPSCR
jgi:hypothetical protein